MNRDISKPIRWLLSHSLGKERAAPYLRILDLLDGVNLKAAADLLEGIKDRDAIQVGIALRALGVRL